MYVCGGKKKGVLTALVEFKGLQERQEVKKELNTNLSIPSGWNESAAPREWAGWGAAWDKPVAGVGLAFEEQ